MICTKHRIGNPRTNGYCEQCYLENYSFAWTKQMADQAAVQIMQHQDQIVIDTIDNFDNFPIGDITK